MKIEKTGGVNTPPADVNLYRVELEFHPVQAWDVEYTSHWGRGMTSPQKMRPHVFYNEDVRLYLASTSPGWYGLVWAEAVHADPLTALASAVSAQAAPGKGPWTAVEAAVRYQPIRGHYFPGEVEAAVKAAASILERDGRGAAPFAAIAAKAGRPQWSFSRGIRTT